MELWNHGPKGRLLNKSEKDIVGEYENIYGSSDSFRRQWEGEISIRYKLPKYTEIFAKEFIEREKPTSILEIGAGDGEMTERVVEACKGRMSLYVSSEISSAGAAKISRRGIKVFQASALDIPAKAGSFDACVAFDVMHHVRAPAKMAAEMVRVARRFVFLIEPNRMALGRRLLEKTGKYKSVGEHSYFPAEYRDFFMAAGAKNVMMKPFLFIVPKTPKVLIPLAKLVSEAMERIPLMRWQCSSLAITVYK